jgi:hypothetical protein
MVNRKRSKCSDLVCKRERTCYTAFYFIYRVPEEENIVCNFRKILVCYE